MSKKKELTVKEIKAELRYDIAATKKVIREYVIRKHYADAAEAQGTLSTLKYVMDLIEGKLE